MLSMQGIICKRLKAQDQLPEKFKDLACEPLIAGQTYNKDGVAIALDSNTDLMLNKAANLDPYKLVYLINPSSPLDQKAPWHFEFSYKVSPSSTNYSTYIAYVVDPYAPYTSVGGSSGAGYSSSKDAFSITNKTGVLNHVYSKTPYAQGGVSYGAVANKFATCVVECDGTAITISLIDTTSKTVIKSITNDVAAKHFYDSGQKKLVPVVGGIRRGCVVNMYLKDIRFEYDGQILFCR